ncbi:beta-(1-3)-glucosyl transferase, partial [Pseudomonas aeruginosa]
MLSSLAIASAALVVLSFSLLLIDSSSLLQCWLTFLAVVSFSCASLLLWLAYAYRQQYSPWFSPTGGPLLCTGSLGVVIGLFTDANELAEGVMTQ